MSFFDEERAVVDPPRPWFIALLGYYLAGVAEAIGQYASFGGFDLWRTLLAGVTLGAFHMLVFGVIGVWLGSKIFRGPATVSGSIHAVGACMLVPSIVAVPLSIMLLTPWGASNPLLSLGLLFLLVLVALWIWVRIWFAVRTLNGFGAGRTWGVVLWVPVLVVVIGLVGYLVMPPA